MIKKFLFQMDDPTKINIKEDSTYMLIKESLSRGIRCFYNSPSWVYASLNKYNQIKLPISHNGKNCSGEYGCDELMNGDTINIPELNGSFTVKIYENEGLHYIPY